MCDNNTYKLSIEIADKNFNFSGQLDFFIISMILQGINSSAVATYQVHSMTILAKFPTKYTKLFLLGQNGGILTDILQIISISVTDSDSDAALIFFITGTIIVAGNICLSFGMKYTKIYAYYLSENSLDEVTEKDGSTSSSWAEVRHVAKLIWPIIAMLGIYMFTSSCVHPSVTTLVQSKHVLDGKAWERKYFTAVIVFLLADVSCLLGTSIFIGKIKKSNYPIWLVGMMIRMVISVGFVTLCNAQPRKNLPIVFHEDWQFVLFIIVYNVTLGYSWNVCFLSVRGLSEGKQELALKLITSAVTIAGAVFSVNGVIVVKLL